MDLVNLPLYYEFHVFCCQNRREPGHARGCCAEKGSEVLREYMKARCKALGIKKTRINTSGCLDRCELGPVMVVYPEGVWYHYQSQDDIDEIIQKHIVNGEIVERLVLKPEQKRL